ncbi:MULTISPECIES: ABC transporter ATP-binding protein [unclassified Haladaptatus]|uniref:ABC transporter ATP-binding protein n=1 Tax=unclassified Haladaptatus TaxID=2622732 RepID=UPI00209C5B95|nr:MULTISPECIES: ABC transporter ATP-binding protein [unclassified Haladaptatus]MCO8246735.1 ABC transporter ATP-binding protein [Haladaptatus sp. AB643]MCO8256383.1 ABC transporter ATP-binding protein [Haladaptatus sp. AB618]
MATNYRSTPGASTPPDEDVILEVRDASVSFSMDRGDSRVLRDVSIDVHAGEVLGIVGESGSGKSMLASAMLDAIVSPGQVDGEVIYHPPDGGEPMDVLSLSREELTALRWNEISFVIQGAQSAFNPTMTIGSHFEETLRAHDADRTEGMAFARELLADLYLDADRVLRSHPHELSGGMKQRALIALGLVLDPNVVVMDEPTAALDLLMQRSIIGMLEDLQAKYDLTMVFVTHDLPLIADLADRLAVMYAFDLVELGPTDELLDHAAHPYTRALLNAVPNISDRAMDIEGIEGSSPDPVSLPKGCSFNPRCPLADETCRTEVPHLHDVADGHDVACFHWRNAREEIPLTLGDSGADVSADVNANANGGERR